MAPKRLGKGLDALLGPGDGPGEVMEVNVGNLSPGKHQPREAFKDEDIGELAASIKETGILQPVVVRAAGGDAYEIVMGERRWRAAKAAGLKTIPAIVREITDKDALVMALVENIQRKDLNAIEKARAFKRLIETLSLNQTQASKRLGVSRVAVSNTLRLLELPSHVKDMVIAGKLSAGHARALLMVKDARKLLSLANKITAEGLSVRQVEQMLSPRRREKKRKIGRKSKPSHILAIEKELSQLVGTRVKVEGGTSGGKFIIEFYGSDDYENIVAMLRGGAGRAAGGKKG